MRVAWLLLSTCLLTAATGCGSDGEEYCEVYCDCADCSAKEREICLVQFDAEADVASVYECDQEYSDLESCVIAKADCPGGNFNTDECNTELEEYQSCKD
jgi:hypothetical protein